MEQGRTCHSGASFSNRLRTSVTCQRCVVPACATLQGRIADGKGKKLTNHKGLTGKQVLSPDTQEQLLLFFAQERENGVTVSSERLALKAEELDPKFSECVRLPLPRLSFCAHVRRTAVCTHATGVERGKLRSWSSGE